MRNSRLAAAALLLIVSAAAGQSDKKQDSLLSYPRQSVKVNLLQLISFYPAVSTAYEWLVTPDLGVQFEAGYVFSLSEDTRYLNKRGTKLRTALRWYAPNLTRTARSRDFLAFEPYMNVINFDRQRWEIECFDLECLMQYDRLHLDVVRYREQGAALKWGHAGFGKHIIYEVTVGVRLRRIRYQSDVLDGLEPSDVEFYFPEINETDRVAFGFVVGYSLGWRIR